MARVTARTQYELDLGNLGANLGGIVGGPMPSAGAMDIAREVLGREGVTDHEARVRLGRALDAFARETAEVAMELRAAGIDGNDDALATFDDAEAEDAKTNPGRYAVLWHDAALLRALARHDRTTAESARSFRVAQAHPIWDDDADHPPRRRWALWVGDAIGPDDVTVWRRPEIPLGFFAVAQALWRLSGVDAWKALRERSKSSRPATMVVVNTAVLVPYLAGHVEARDREIVRDGRVLGLIDRDAPRLVAHGVARGGSVLGHRLVKYLVHRAHAAKEAGRNDFRLVVVDGGWSGLAVALGASPNDQGLLQSIVKAGATIEWSVPGARGLLWSWVVRSSAPGRAAALEFSLSSLLLPGVARELADPKLNAQAAQTRAIEARRLVPELRTEPPLEGIRERDHGAAWTLARLFVLELANKSAELVHGGIKITKARWVAMADEAAFPAATLPKLLELWQRGDRTAPPLLVTLPGDRYHLAPEHDLERAFLESAGARRRAGRTDGRKGASKRWGAK